MSGGITRLDSASSGAMSGNLQAVSGGPVADLERVFRAELAVAEPPDLELLAAYVDGELEPAEGQALAAWMEVDPALASEVAGLAALRAELVAEGQLRMELEVPVARRRLPRRYIAAAATLALALGSSWLATRTGRPSHSEAMQPVEVAPVVNAVSAPSQLPPAVESPSGLPTTATAQVAPRGTAPAALSGPGSFESGTLRGWQLESMRLDFEGGQLGGASSNSGA